MARPNNVPVAPNTASQSELALWVRQAAERTNYLLAQYEALEKRVAALEAK